MIQSTGISTMHGVQHGSRVSLTACMSFLKMFTITARFAVVAADAYGGGAGGVAVLEGEQGIVGACARVYTAPGDPFSTMERNP